MNLGSWKAAIILVAILFVVILVGSFFKDFIFGKKSKNSMLQNKESIELVLVNAPNAVPALA